MKITFVRRKYLLEYPLVALQGIGNIFDGLVMFLSLGTLVSNLSLQICKIRTNYFFNCLKKHK